MTLYLNNSGSRWIEVTGRDCKRHMPIILVLPDGTRKPRQADYYEAFGNFAVINFRYCGRRYTGVGNDVNRMDSRGPNDDGKTYVWLADSRGYTAV